MALKYGVIMLLFIVVLVLAVLVLGLEISGPQEIPRGAIKV